MKWAIRARPRWVRLSNSIEACRYWASCVAQLEFCVMSGVLRYFDSLLLVTRAAQKSNSLSVVGVCSIIACILHNAKLTIVYFDHHPYDCVHNDAWLREGLAVPMDDVISKGWTAVVEFLRKVL